MNVNLVVDAESTQANPAMPGRLDANLDANPEAPDAVEAALADALTKAAAAGRFDVVGQLARELEARRAPRAGIVDLARERRRRDRAR